MLIAIDFENFLLAADHDFSSVFQPLESSFLLFPLSTLKLVSSYDAYEVDFDPLLPHKLDNVNVGVKHNLDELDNVNRECWCQTQSG